MNQKFLTENDRMLIKIERAIIFSEIAIGLLILTGLLYILFWLMTGTGSQRGSIEHDPGFPHQVYRPVIDGKASYLAGQVNLVAMVEAKKAIPVTGDGLIRCGLPAKKSIFEHSQYSRPFENRQPVIPKFANIGAYGCLFRALSDQWQYLHLQTKPLPRACNSFIERFLSHSDGIIDMTSQAGILEFCVPLLASHSDYYSGMAL